MNLRSTPLPARIFGLTLIFLCTLAANAQPQMEDLTSHGPADPFPPRSKAPNDADLPTRHAPERYIWTSGNNDADAVFFRANFNLESIPASATFYLAGPRSATVYLNGRQIGQFAQDPDSGIRPVVFTAPVAAILRPGRNAIAIEAHPTHNPSYMPTDYMLLRGQYLIAKIVPAAEGVDAPPIFVSDDTWRTQSMSQDGWQRADFDGSAWPRAISLGPMDSDIDNYQWNADGGLYRWPGYRGIAPYLRHLSVPAAKVLEPVASTARFEHLAALTHGESFSLRVPATGYNLAEPPSTVLDFGRELNGRLRVALEGASPARLLLQYGESLEEAVNKPYLGSLPLLANPGTPAYGQKTAFRYVKIVFLNGPSYAQFKIDADAIYYPVNYTGSFASSDPQLNRIWAVGAYTAHLCMQDSIWDAPKRDRGRWMGDLEISGRVLETAFDDRFLIEDTLRRLNDFKPQQQKDVNGIPGYSAMWVMGLADYYRHSGRKAFLLAEAPHLASLLDRMRHDIDKDGLYSTEGGSWPFVDWSRDLAGPTAEARRATHLEYYRAFVDGAYLLREAAMPQEAMQSEQTAAQLRAAANRFLVDPASGTFGNRWQTNAMAIDSGLANPEQIQNIRRQIFSSIDAGQLPGDDLSPYYGSYVLDAMAAAGDRTGALTFLREWWGGMLEEGATSFWEGYDPRWPKQNFHANLKADGAQGYFVSLAHGWSAGPTAWLTEQVLGIQPTAPGFRTMLLRPDLLGLAYAKGSEATPHGLLRVDIRNDNGLALSLDLPEGIQATVSMPVSSASGQLTVDGKVVPTIPAENGTRRSLILAHGGHFEIHANQPQ